MNEPVPSNTVSSPRSALWRHMHDEHGLTLLVSELDEIERLAKACSADEPPVRQLVLRQASDDGLWFQAQTAPEAYLQQELRKLHAAIEGEPIEFKRPVPPPAPDPIFPIARLTIAEDDTVTAVMYTPGLPPGVHDVYPAPSPPPRQTSAAELADEIEAADVETIMQGDLLGRVADFLRSAQPPSNDTARLDWLNEQLVDTIYLDDGRIIDVGGHRRTPHDIRRVIDEARGVPIRQPEQPPPADRGTTHADGCWSWGPKHYDCALAEIKHAHEVIAHQGIQLWQGQPPAVPLDVIEALVYEHIDSSKFQRARQTAKAALTKFGVPDSAPDVHITAQHQETGRMWQGLRRDLPRGYTEVTHPGENHG